MVTVSPSCSSAALDARSVDERPVDAAVVADLGARGGRHQGRVVARREHVGDDDVVVGVAADLDRARRRESAGRPGRRIFSMLVARLPSLERGAAIGPIAVTDSSAGWDRPAAQPAATRPPAAGSAVTANRCSSAAGRSGSAAAGSTGSPAADRTGTPAGGTRAVAAVCGCWLGQPPLSDGRDGDRRGRRSARGLLPADLERQLRAVRVADVDVLAVLDVDGRHPAAVDVHPVEAAVVDRDPPTLVEPQHQVCPGDQWVGDAYVGAKIATDDDIVSSGEGAC